MHGTDSNCKSTAGRTSISARRTFLKQSGVGLGIGALGALLADDSRGATATRLPTDALAGLPHHRPRVKRVIFLCMAGGPSHLETFDFKTELVRRDREPMPTSLTEGQPIAQLQSKELRILAPRARFVPCGQSGQRISDLLPWHRKMADDICVVNSMVTEQINHDPAHTFLNTGTITPNRPSMGAWVTYGLGSETLDLPAFVVLTSQGGRNPQPIASRQWASGNLPSRYQGVQFNAAGAPVHYVQNPPGVSQRAQRRLVDTVGDFDKQLYRRVGDPEIATRLAAYEMAFRMQTAVPELMDLSGEPQHVFDAYQATPGDGSFASNCIMARRLAERGVRFIQLYHRGWDHHDNLDKYMKQCCELTDRPAFALINDLKERGMLDETLVIWGGEFGRTPMSQGSDRSKIGRDHHIKGFSMWLSGGGIQGGTTYGKTDDFGYHATENPVHIRDLHATMLDMLGIDYRRFSVRSQGLDVRLTGVEEPKVLTNEWT
ncbi:DUF1501 domain-containing protein [Aeoliella sp. ICT_H6.2]|uniref:DUF1501 domain-containing protein n=1 Tax=Aeoliella straminimaris TaxID=2954799 RepID=A0A9X2FDQ9_9BACT|nr:DUF1501 domain-containing protein [Aeoliella straminimaris]MCO6047075.1 DUF1501 domain-containing protein [Aeoliella straminimaris]